MAFNRDSRGGGRGGFQSRGRSNFSPRGPREMFSATCSNCGKECQVPFRPTGTKPVYCSDCFEKMGGRNEDRPQRSERSDFRAPTEASNQNRVQFDELNAKLDRILILLEPKEIKVEKTVSEPVEVKVVREEVKTPKVKKAKVVASEE